jgi:DMSO/TMAO reductase YedYZ molybdopterin-dependent catalytic subunit
MSRFLALTHTANTAVVFSVDMESALRPQTILTVDFERAPLTSEWGAPLRLRIPTKLGFKSAKNLQSIEVTNSWRAGASRLSLAEPARA